MTNEEKFRKHLADHAEMLRVASDAVTKSNAQLAEMERVTRATIGLFRDMVRTALVMLDRGDIDGGKNHLRAIVIPPPDSGAAN
jgi:hypothetical protein